MTSLQALIQKTEAMRDLPPSGVLQDPEAALEVLKHLAMLWSPEPPERRHTRHSVKSRAHHRARLRRRARRRSAAAPDRSTSTRRRAESWVVENVSAGGFGAIVPQVKTDWLHVGTLLAMQPDGGTNWIVGTVRRVSRTTPNEARVGIETLSRAPREAKFRVQRPGRRGDRAPAASAVLGSGEVAVALRSGVYPPGHEPRGDSAMAASTSTCRKAVAERDEDYELVRFRDNDQRIVENRRRTPRYRAISSAHTECGIG